jgi:hypothetical protein
MAARKETASVSDIVFVRDVTRTNESRWREGRFEVDARAIVPRL